MDDKNITLLSILIDKYNVIKYITKSINSICEFVKGSTKLPSINILFTAPLVRYKYTNSKNKDNGGNYPNVKFRSEFT